MFLKTRGKKLLNSDHVLYWSVISNGKKFFIGYETIVDSDVKPLTGEGFETETEALEVLMELQDLLNNPNSYEESKKAMSDIIKPVTNLSDFKKLTAKM